MATLMQMMTNRPGGIYQFEEFDWWENSSLVLNLQIVEYPGGPPVDCTGWEIDSAGIYGDPIKPVAGDLGVGLLSSLSSSGVLGVISTTGDNAAGKAGSFPAGREGHWFVRVKNGSYKTYLVAPSPIQFRQAPAGTP